MVYGKNTSLNDPFRGVKGEVFEGGIRTPLYIQWPAKYQKSEYTKPVISLDLLPTCVAIAESVNDQKLDGVNLMPYINGELESAPHKDLYWRWFRNWAIRRGQWKLIVVNNDERYLFNLAKDKYETTNVINEHPIIYRNLHTSLKQWNSELKPAMWRHAYQEQILAVPLQ